MNVDICFVLPGYLEALTERGGGRENRLLKIAIGLSRQFDVSMIAPFLGKYERRTQVSSRMSVTRVYFPATSKYPHMTNFAKFMSSLSISLYSFGATIQIIRFRKAKLKVVIVSDLLGNIFPAIIANLLGMKVLFYEGNLTPWVSLPTSKELWFPKALLQTLEFSIGRLMNRLSSALVVNDNLIKEGMIRSGIDGKKIHVIRGGVDLELFTPLRMRRSESEFNVGFIGRLSEEKGASHLLALCETALRRIPSVSFFLFGDGPYAERFGRLSNVRHIGQIDHCSLSRLLSQIDVVMSFQGSFGMAEIEARSSGKPIIAFNIGEMPMLVRNNEDGILCKANSTSFVDAISMLMSNKSMLAKLSENSRTEAESCYDWKIVVNNWKSVILRT